MMKRITSIKTLAARAAVTLLLALLTTATAWADITGSGTSGDPFVLNTADDWATFAANVNVGTNANSYYKLSDTWDNSGSAVTATVGTIDHPFTGTFDGNGKTLNVSISETSTQGTAPFRYISDGAVIKNLTVEGSVTGTTHAAGLVGFSKDGTNESPNTIEGCTVRASVTVNTGSNKHMGGVVGHGLSSYLKIKDTVFGGTMTNGGNYAGGLQVWSDGNHLTLDNCIFTGSYSGSGSFHPIAIHYTGSTTTATVSAAYYTAAPTLTDAAYIAAAGTQVSTSTPSGVVYGQVIAADNQTYYAPVTFSGINVYYLYIGSEIPISYTVTAADGTELTKGTHYTESISPATVQDKGDYTLTITGTGSYSGSQTFNFTVGDGIPVTSETTTMTTGTYIVTENVTIGSRITISGTVTLNLGTGATLTASKGIAVHEGNSLTIDGTGTLNAYIAYQQYNDAAIGGGNGSNAGTIIINGGTINAYGKYNGAAIGGGYNGNGGNIIINGGTVNADSKTNKSKGAGIGGGFVGDGNVGDGGNITINGGTITAKSFNGTGIGGGYNGNGGIITITGGNITATAGNYSAGIGGGCFGNAGTISITGGVINVSCGEYGAGIGGGGTSDSTTSAGGGGTIAISGGQITVTSSGGYGIGAGKSDYGNDGAEGTISLSWSESTDFISASSYVGDINFVAGKRFYYYETTDYATKDGMYKQNRKIVPAIGEVSSLAMAEIRMPRYYITTSGTAVNVDYSVYDYNENELTLGTDYTAVIRNSSNAEVTTFDQLGDYTLTVTGKGAYTGSKSYTFSLVEIDPGLTQDGSEYYVNFPNPGRETISLSSGQTIKVYDSEGKSGNVVAGDGFLMLYAPEGCALEVTGKIDAIHYDSGTGVYTNSLNAYEGEDESVQITSIDRNSESISFASGGNKMLLRFYAPIVYTGHYGLDLTVRVIQATPHTVTKGTCTNGDITIDKTSANTNETVTLTVNPASGYLLKRITITDTDNSTTLSTIGEDNWYSEENTVTFKMPSKNVTVTPEFTNDLTATNGLALQIDPLRVKAYTIPEIAKSFNITGSANNNSSTTAVLKAHEGYRLQATGNVDFIGSKYDDSEITIYDGANTSATLLTNIKGKSQDEVSIGTQTSSSNYMTIYLYEDEHNAVFTGKISIAPIQYSIGYDLAGGSVATENPTTYTIESDAITLNNPTRDYYTFAGWTGTDLDAASTSVTIAKGSYGNRSYTATWKPIDYTITYDLAGGSVATENPTTYTIESDAITLNNPTREGYTFAGWTGTGLDAATTNVTIAAGSSGNREYTATWTAIEYNITYNGVEGATFSTTYNSYTIESADIALDTPAKTGYDFGGWYANSGLTGSAVTTIAAGSYGDIELWAKWTASENINLAANQAPDGNCWTTFYCGDAGYTIDDGENACAYTATYSDGKLTLHNQGKTIAKGEAVIIVADNDEVSMTKGADGTKSDDNDLHGVDVETSRDDIQTTLGEGTFYVLGMTNGNFGFHKYTGATMAARKAFVLVGGSNAALARSLTMVFDDATGITTVHGSGFTVNGSDAWYSLDGRRLQGKPTKSGVYVNNGKKIVIK